MFNKIPNTNSELQYTQLTVQLSEFGLDPNEWNIQPIARVGEKSRAGQWFLIISQQTNGFKFLGEAIMKRKFGIPRPYWKKMTLLSV